MDFVLDMAKDEWISFDSELKIDDEATRVTHDPLNALNEVSLEEEKPVPVVSPKLEKAVIDVTQQEQSKSRRQSIDSGFKSGDVEPQPISKLASITYGKHCYFAGNSKILATVFPTNQHLAWIIPPRYDSTKLPQTLSAHEVGLPVDIFTLVMRYITDDYRFKSYTVGFSRVLPMWVMFSIIVLLLMLLSSPNGGFTVMIMTFFWVIMLFIGIFFAVIIRKYVSHIVVVKLIYEIDFSAKGWLITSCFGSK